MIKPEGVCGAVTSTVTVKTGEAGPVLPATSVARTVSWWLPSLRFTDGVKLQLPLLPTTAVPMAMPLS